MSNATVPLAEKVTTREQQAEKADHSLPAWWVVFKRELGELWIWGKALTLIILYSVYLGISSYIFAANSELSLIPPKEMVYLTLSGSITVGLFVALIIGADSFSGERERATLEALLLTPAKRAQIVIGKYLASISPWPVAFLISIPYVVVLSQGDAILPTGLLWGAILGALLSLAFTGFAMLISLWSGSNRTSLFASLTIYLLFLLPVQFPGGAQTGTFGKLLKKLDPLEGADHFLEKIIVNNRTVQELMPYLWGSIIFALLIFIILFFFAAPRLRLDAGFPIRWRRKKRNTTILSLLLAAFLLLSFGLIPAQAQPPQAFDSANLQISIDTTSALTKNGDKVEFHTTVMNKGSEASPPLIVAMNIINLDSTGDVVDPEDWSPERTQYLESLEAGKSATQSWTLNTILEGEYMVYVVLIPTPESDNRTSQPVTSQGIHVKVNQFTRLNPGGILPFAVGIPIILVLILAGVLWMRRRGVDTGGSE
jgi:ABC-type transport system involved in multi-copper enzyme maturation permease subunit